MKEILSTALLLWFCLIGFAQIPTEDHINGLYSGVELITPEEELRMANLPRLKLSPAARATELPTAVNNAERPWMPPIYYQVANECGQSSSISFTFGYEINRKRNHHASWGYDYLYPSHFAWNFCNKGSNRGVSFMESWDVIRTAGTPNVTEWGGWFSTGGHTKWMSGYDLYYSAMRNRISDFYAIPIDNEEGLLILKHWLSNHLAGESTGGLANFYCTYLGNSYLSVIPAGSPEAGKHILTEFHSNVNHAKTIVGYNDDVRWDYNNDGRFTNDEDINNDGVVDLRDWEIGAIIFCNSFGTDFGDGGYCYLPYCKMASLPDEGGIWNRCVYVVQVKDEVHPQITYKVTLRHTSREKIKLTAGIANNTAATAPEQTIDFFVFNNQGGDLYMQGGTTEEDKTLELGLDVSPLLNYVQPGQPCQFFLNVEETDPDNEDDGAIVNFSLMDYTGDAVVEQACTSTNVPIANNSTTRLSVVRAIDFSKPEIQDSELPDMQAFVNYQKQLTVTGGKPPYRWEMSKEFSIEATNESMPSTSGQTVLSNSSNGYAIVPLGFEFPYHGDTYSQIVLYADGYIAFHHQPNNWPFLQSTDMQLMAQRLICPFKADLTNCTIHKVAESGQVTFIFTAKLSGQSNSSLNFAVRLHKNGVIDLIYGEMEFTGNSFLSALLRGDQTTIQHTPASGQTAANVSQRSFRCKPSILPDCLTLSANGLLSGKALNAFDTTFSVTCYDNNDVKSTRLLHLSSVYTSRLMITDITVNGHEPPNLYAGDTIRFSISVRNMDTLAYQNCRLRIHTDDPFVQCIDNEEYFGYIGPNNEYTLNRCLVCVADAATTNNHHVSFTLTLENSISPVSATREYTIHAYNITPLHYTISDYGNSNGMLNPIELDTLIFTMKNNGVAMQHVDLQLRLDVPGISIAIGNKHYDAISENDIFDLPTLLYISPEFIDGTTFNAWVDIYIDNHIVKTIPFTISGETHCIDFETGEVPTNLSGAANQPAWVIDNSTTHTGTYSLRSGTIGDNDTSTVSLNFQCIQGKNLNFAYRTSSENKYDKLVCYLDSVEVGNWSGERAWTTTNVPVTSGSHTITWKYIKDINTSGGSDCVWIDDICFPDFDDEALSLNVHPQEVEIFIDKNEKFIDTASLNLENISDRMVILHNTLSDENGEMPYWVAFSPENDFIEDYGNTSIAFTFNAYDCAEGDYHATLHILHTGGELEVPITMHVSEQSSVEEHRIQQLPLVYPNPTTSSVTIRMENLQNIWLYDGIGHLLKRQTSTESSCQLDLSDYPAGIYILLLTNDKGETSSTKIVKK